MEAKLQIFFGISTHHGRNPVGCFPSHVCPSDFADVHGADCIENGQNHDPYVGKNCEPHIDYAEHAEYEAYSFYAESHDDVLPYDTEAFARYAYGLADLARVIVHVLLRRLAAQATSWPVAKYEEASPAPKPELAPMITIFIYFLLPK